ncbi:MAG: cobalamin biosynthesis protein [Bacillota bacterium]|nr:cobalamin biosynthesis protein [Bacillota bacterium]
MKIGLFAYTRQACRTARAVMLLFPREEIRAYTMERFEEKGFAHICRPTAPFYGELFSWADALVFVSACGIAVREIAPHVREKQSDPAVICIDEQGHFVIPLLSGHIGAGNELALRIADALHASPVITTATDINKRFSVDAWAARNNFVIDDLQQAKAVSAAILERDIPLSCDFGIATELPGGLVSADSGELGICISYRKKAPFVQTLRLIPKILHIGIGCRKGSSDVAIREAVNTVIDQEGLDKRAVRCVASIDLKAEEEGLLKYCEENGLMPVFYSSAELLEVPGSFTPSSFVQSVTGVDNVCERAALLGADELIVRKTAVSAVTVAVAVEKLEVRFG